MQEQTNEEVKQEIAALRARYNRLKAICGQQAISRQTMESYSRELARLQSKLN
jgi:SMC interacting uncharacterized protein involved in chromosome segregation